MKNLSFLILFVSVIAVIGMSSCQKEPTASFTSDKDSIGTLDEVVFTNTSAEGDHYEWDFGDGLTSTDKNPTHTYTTKGVYTVKLTAYSKNGKKSTDATTSITVIAKSFDYNNVKYSLSKGLLMQYTTAHELYGMGITLYSGYSLITSGNDIIDMFGTGNYVKFMIYTNDATILSPGIFNYNTVSNVGTFSPAEFAIEYSLAKNEKSKHNIVGGSISIKKTGINYEITFTCTDDSDYTVSGSFYGPLTLYNPYYPNKYN